MAASILREALELKSIIPRCSAENVDEEGLLVSNQCIPAINTFYVAVVQAPQQTETTRTLGSVSTSYLLDELSTP